MAMSFPLASINLAGCSKEILTSFPIGAHHDSSRAEGFIRVIRGKNWDDDIGEKLIAPKFRV